MSILPLLKTGGEEQASLLPSRFGIGVGFSPPLPKMGAGRASVFARVQSYLHIQQQIRQKKLESKNKTRKVRVTAHNPFHTNLFSRRFRPPDHCQRLSNFYPVCFC